MFPLLAASQDVVASHRHCFSSLAHFNSSKSLISHTKEQNSSSSRVHRCHAHSSVSFDENSPTALYFFSRARRRREKTTKTRGQYLISLANRKRTRTAARCASGEREREMHAHEIKFSHRAAKRAREREKSQESERKKTAENHIHAYH